MAVKELAMHEKLEVHEVLIFKTACATKSKAMLELVQDKKLKEQINHDMEKADKALELAKG